MKISISSSIIPTLALLSSLCASTNARTDSSGTRSGTGSQQRYRITIDSKQPIFSSCSDGTLETKVLTSTGKPVSNTAVTFYVATASRSGGKSMTVTKTARTARTGKATFDFSLTKQQRQRLAGQELQCSVAVENRFVRGGKQVLPCPQAIQVCAPQDCSEEPVTCEGDMMFNSMCEALDFGMTEDDCVTDEYDPECERMAGYVKCTGPFGEYWFENYCIARSHGNSVNMCDFVDESEVPECAKTGDVVCDEAGITYPNMCHALTDGLDEASCKPN
jgi:hypothetical protein